MVFPAPPQRARVSSPFLLVSPFFVIPSRTTSLALHPLIRATLSDLAGKWPREDAPISEPAPKKARDAPETNTPAPEPMDLEGEFFSTSAQTFLVLYPPCRVLMAPVVDAGGGDPTGQADIDPDRSALEMDPAGATAPTGIAPT